MKNKLNIKASSEDNLRDLVGTGGEFPVPDGYFEGFNERLRARLQVQRELARPRSKSFQLIFAITSAAAAVTLAFFLFKSVNQPPASKDSNKWVVNDYTEESYITYLVYTTAEQNLFQPDSAFDSLSNNDHRLTHERAQSKENLDPEEVIEYLFYNNGNVYTIMDWK
ncbi:MAG: hypothetical protein ACP5O2_11330 [Bacteroidales bacterium]